LDDQLTNRISRFLANRTSSRASERSGEYVVASSVGFVREENQDAALIVKARYHVGAAERDFDLAVVCDGLGGMKQGAEAAVLGLSTFAARLIRSSRASVEDRLLSGLREANAQIFKLLRGSGGTTLSAVLTGRSGESTICHVGDSRIYSVSSAELRQLTHDDTIGAALNKEGSLAHEPRDTRLLQFVGMGDDLEAHIFPLRLADTKAYLLTSDGAHDLPHGLLQRVVLAARQNFEVARRLVQLSEFLGGLDNATVAAIPSSFAAESDRPSEGLDLNLLAPWGHLSIWIPQLSDDRGAQQVNNGAKSDSTAGSLPSHDVEERHPPLPPTGKNQGSKKTKKKIERKKIPENGDELPLSAALEIEFPEGKKE
jgi:serine/threonine protein phosphatase PrpC